MEWQLSHLKLDFLGYKYNEQEASSVTENDIIILWVSPIRK